MWLSCVVLLCAYRIRAGVRIGCLRVGDRQCSQESPWYVLCVSLKWGCVCDVGAWRTDALDVSDALYVCAVSIHVQQRGRMG